MSATAQIELVHRPLERVSADLVVVGLFSDDRPLRGGAARVDWRLCGLISSLLMNGDLTGQCGEAVLMPSPGSLRAPRLLLLGLGERAKFRMASAQDVMRDAAARCLDLALRRLAVAPIGIASDDFARHAPAVVGGLAAGLEDSKGVLELRLVMPAQETDRALQALETAMRSHAFPAISLRGAERTAARGSAGPRTPAHGEVTSPRGRSASP